MKSGVSLEVVGSLESVLSIFSDGSRRRYGVDVVSGRGFVGGGVPSLVGEVVHLYGGHGVCWSGRFVGDVGRSFGGVCVSRDGKCWWESRMAGGSRSSGYGCGEYGIGMTSVVVENGSIEWKTAGESTMSGVRCFVGGDDGVDIRGCEFAAGAYPRGLAGAGLVETENWDDENGIDNNNFETVGPGQLFGRACGCSNWDDVEYVNDSLCRYRETGNCGTNDCGSEFYCGRWSALCRGCPDGQVGECEKIENGRVTGCTGKDEYGNCPSGYSACSEVWGAGVWPSVVLAGGGGMSVNSLDVRSVVWNNGTTAGNLWDLWGLYLGREFGDVDFEEGGGVPVDDVNCGFSTKPGLILEQPRLGVPGGGENEYGYPGGLSEEKLVEWCGMSTTATTCSFRGDGGEYPIRGRFCVWTSGECRLRVLRQPDYDVYGAGKADYIGYHSIMYPSCFSWVR